MSKLGVHLIVEGRVQGVGFRYFSQRIGTENNVKGFVRNLADGNVEVVAEGPEAKLKLLLEWCWQGPDYASVSDIQVKWLDQKNEFSEFNVQY